MLEHAGAGVLRCPLLTVSPTPNTRSFLSLMEDIDSFDLLLFNSPNAANLGLPRIESHCSSLPGRMKIAAIGAKTAHTITDLGYQVDICPAAGFDSESLLKLPILQNVSGMKIAILRGAGGRDLSGSVLRARGAEVVYIQVYERLPPTKEEFGRIEQALLHNRFDVVALTSGEAFLALWGGVGAEAQRLLNQATFLFGSRRIAAIAQTQGLQAPIEIADDPSDEAMFLALTAWAERPPNG
ncbi:MAG TPA: uroporphyrinogen-III synthase [Nitrococcus sp.]|nr:uroporphyrinogen-III synthase [Nitrococcus sp.]